MKAPSVDDHKRPVLFAFNGGPGSSTAWTHLGWLGPYRVADGDTRSPRPVPPFDMTDNPDAPLDVADIVLIDPPGTGWSRVLDKEKAPWFYSTRGDAIATLRFIASWCRLHRRQEAPKFLLGESYGTIRAAVMAGMSIGGPTATGRTEALALHGVVLVGSHLWPTRVEDPDLRAAMHLPVLAATAWYHGRTRGDMGLGDHVAEARAFAAGDSRLARADEYGAEIVLLDAPSPGSGKVFDWRLAEGVPRGRRLVLAGGLEPENVSEAIRTVHPWGVDVSTGVESRPGVKDPRKMRAFVQAAKSAEPGPYEGAEETPFDWEEETNL
jgi:hypothetical protein